MEQILLNIKNPEWWFTGLFFLVIGIAIAKAINSWLPVAWKKLVHYVPALNRGISRWLKLRLLLKVKKNRQKDLYINWVIGRYWSLFLLFIIYTGFVLFYYAISEDFSLEKGIKGSMLVAVLPIYAFSILMTFEKKYLFRLLREDYKWKQRITKRSTGLASSRG